MKKIGKYLKDFCRVLIFTILVTSLFLLKADAKGKHELVIKFDNFKEITQTVDGSILDSLVFDIWRLDDDFDLGDIGDKIKEFNYLPNSTLDEKFSKGFERKALIGNDLVTISDMDDGIYFIRERASNNRIKYLSPIIVKISGDDPVIILYGKATGEEPGKPNGGFDIEKVSDSGEKLEGVEFTLYSIKDGKKTPTPLDLLNGTYIYNKSGKSVTLITDKDGNLRIRNLPYGRYILEETRPLKGYSIITKFIEINIESSDILKKTVVNKEDTPNGGRRFLKISDDKNKSPLKGAKFGVYQYINGKYVLFKRHGEDLILISDKDGYFEVKDLPYGKYYLKELEAPDGYYKLEGYLEFEINSNSYDEYILIIKNKSKPSPPPPPDTPNPNRPNTGDLGYVKYLIYGLGAVVLLILIRRKKNDE